MVAHWTEITNQQILGVKYGNEKPKSKEWTIKTRPYTWNLRKNQFGVSFGCVSESEYCAENGGSLADGKQKVLIT